MTKEKLFYVAYSLQFADGISKFNGFIYAEDKIDAQQIINQIACDLKTDEHIIFVVDEGEKWSDYN